MFAKLSQCGECTEFEQTFILSGKVEYIQESRDFRKVFRIILSFVCVSEMVPSCRQRRPGTMVPGLGNGPFIYFMRAEDHLTETEERRWCRHIKHTVSERL